MALVKPVTQGIFFSYLVVWLKFCRYVTLRRMVFRMLQLKIAVSPCVLSAIPECIGIALPAFDRNSLMPLSSETTVNLCFLCVNFTD